MPGCKVHFAGPDCEPGRLRDLLAERVAAVPRGGAIDWVTYYFRDRRLAAGLVAARKRGVRVRVTLEGRPRTAHASRAVIGLLADELGSGLRVVQSRIMDDWERAKFWRARLHEKLYCFSHPEPVALIGSFNPSGDVPEEDPEAIREIGDQDRGYNLLVEIGDARLAKGLAGHARRVHRMHHGVQQRLTLGANRVLRGAGLEIHFTPRLSLAPVLQRLPSLAAGSRVRIVASHLSGRLAKEELIGLVQRGVDLEVLAEQDERRVPPEVVKTLREAGVDLRRVVHGERVPMHDKFMLIEQGGERELLFGSSHWTKLSLHRNREIHAISRDPALFERFAERWETLRARADG